LRLKVNIILIICFAFSSCYFLGPSPKKRLTKIASVKPIDVAIVPGLPLKNGQWDTLLKTRVLWSVFLYKNGYVKNIIYSGNSVYSKWVEGKAMAQYAIKLGVKPEHIFIDSLAEHSTENLYLGCKMAKEKGFTSIALATDPFQCAMLYKFSKKKIAEKIYFLPVIADSIKHHYHFNQCIDSNSCVNPDFIPIEQRQNYTERINGSRGKNIKK
jgi:vancomycin permeability regulator SanA